MCRGWDIWIKAFEGSLYNIRFFFKNGCGITIARNAFNKITVLANRDIASDVIKAGGSKASGIKAKAKTWSHKAKASSIKAKAKT